MEVICEKKNWSGSTEWWFYYRVGNTGFIKIKFYCAALNFHASSQFLEIFTPKVLVFLWFSHFFLRQNLVFPCVSLFESPPLMHNLVIFAIISPLPLRPSKAAPTAYSNQK